MTTFTREDYEMAAKAVGFIDDQTSDDEDSLGLRRNGQGIFYVVGKRGWHNWKPPEDDGDAARLECAIGLEVQWYEDDVLVGKLVPLGKEFFDTHGGDKNKARRYATFRAAIAIGRAIP